MGSDLGKWLKRNSEELGFSKIEIFSQESGESNDNLVFNTDRGRMVLKRSKEISTDRLENEAKSLEFLEHYNVSNVPRLEIFRENTEIGTVLIQTHEGEKKFSPKNIEDSEIPRLVNAILEHQLDVEKYNNYFDEEKSHKISIGELFRRDFQKWGEKPYREYLEIVEKPSSKLEQLYRKHRDMIEGIKSELELEQTFIHADLAANIRRAGEEFYVIDWELSRVGCPSIELLYLFRHGEVPEEKREKIIEEYSKHRELGEAFQKARNIYPKALQFNDTVWAAKRKEKARKNGEDPSRYEQMFEERLDQLEQLYRK